MIQLDANAGLPATAAAVAAYREASLDFANPSSPHALGRRAAERLAEARATVARVLGVDADEVVFTSGGTEANVLALVGTVRAAGGHPHVVTTSVEHPSVVETLAALATAGEIELSGVSVERHGRVDSGRVVGAVRDDTRLVSVVTAGNETGVLQPVEEIAAALAGHRAVIHTDAVQAIGRVDVAPSDLDLLSLSGHKLGAVGGIGVLWVRAGCELAPFLVGGGQERGRRASTENLAGAASLAAALAGVGSVRAVNAGRMAGLGELRDALEIGLTAGASAFGIEVEVLGGQMPRLANTACVRFCGIPGDAVMMALDQAGIAVSTGSACRVGAPEPSPILMGMGLSAEEASEAVRYSLAPETTREEIEAAVAQTLVVLGRLGSKPDLG